MLILPVYISVLLLLQYTSICLIISYITSVCSLQYCLVLYACSRSQYAIVTVSYSIYTYRLQYTLSSPQYGISQSMLDYLYTSLDLTTIPVVSILYGLSSVLYTQYYLTLSVYIVLVYSSISIYVSIIPILLQSIHTLTVVRTIFTLCQYTILNTYYYTLGVYLQSILVQLDISDCIPRLLCTIDLL